MRIAPACGRQAKGKAFSLFEGLYWFSSIRLLTDIADSFIANGTNTGPIAAGDAFREINLHLFPFHRISTPTAIMTLLRYLSFALRTENKRQHLITTGALHLLLLEIETFNKPFYISSISLQFMKKLLCPFIRKETIEIILLPGEE